MRAQAKPFMTASVREAIAGWGFLLPYALFFVLVVVYPAIKGLLLSFQNYSVIANKGTWVGFANYEAALKDPTFWKSLKNTGWFTALSTPLLVIVGLLLALAVNREFRFRSVFRTIFFGPYVLSIAVVGTLWLWMLQPKYGLIARMLLTLGLEPPNFLFEPNYAMPAIVVATVWWTVGFNMTVFLAGLQDIPQQLYEAAAIDGANTWAQFWNITLPGLRRVMLFITINQVIASFQIFGQVYIMTAGGPAGATRVVIQYIYENAFKYFKPGYGAAMSYLVFLCILILSLIQFRLNKNSQTAE